MRVVIALLAVAALAGCGEDAVRTGQPVEGERREVAPEPSSEPGFDPADPALQVIPDNSAHAAEIIRNAGRRRDFKVPVSAVVGRKPGPLVRAVALRPFYELTEDDAGFQRLNGGQRAILAMYVADFEILNGGFWQFWFNSPARIANDLLPAAERVRAPEFAAIFRDAAALWPGGQVPRSRAKREALLERIDADKIAALDRRYAATQYTRKTALANVLAPYIRDHPEQFVAY